MSIAVAIGMLATAGVTSAFAEGICEKVNKPDFAQYVRITGFAMAGTTVIVTVAGFIKALKQL